MLGNFGVLVFSGKGAVVVAEMASVGCHHYLNTRTMEVLLRN
jgi:hypothetical protein